VLIVPGLYAADDGLLTRINHYIAEGGRALIGFKSGFSDENVKVRSSAQPGFCAELRRQLQPVHPAGRTTVSSCCAEIDCRNDNQAELWMELLTPDDGTRTCCAISIRHGANTPPPPRRITARDARCTLASCRRRA
jgi:beta-galactosidase